MTSDGGLRSTIIRNLPEAHWQAIESPGTSRGIPDLNGCLGGREVWVETKATRGWTVRVSKEQVAWAERRARAQGRVLIAVRQGAGRSTLWLLLPAATRLLYEGARLTSLPSNLVLLVSGGGPAAWPWGKISYLMFPQIRV